MSGSAKPSPEHVFEAFEGRVSRGEITPSELLEGLLETARDSGLDDFTGGAPILIASYDAYLRHGMSSGLGDAESLSPASYQALVGTLGSQFYLLPQAAHLGFRSIKTVLRLIKEGSTARVNVWMREFYGTAVAKSASLPQLETRLSIATSPVLLAEVFTSANDRHLHQFLAGVAIQTVEFAESQPALRNDAYRMLDRQITALIDWGVHPRMLLDALHINQAQIRLADIAKTFTHPRLTAEVSKREGRELQVQERWLAQNPSVDSLFEALGSTRPATTAAYMRLINHWQQIPDSAIESMSSRRVEVFVRTGLDVLVKCFQAAAHAGDRSSALSTLLQRSKERNDLSAPGVVRLSNSLLPQISQLLTARAAALGVDSAPVNPLDPNDLASLHHAIERLCVIARADVALRRSDANVVQVVTGLARAASCAAQIGCERKKAQVVMTVGDVIAQNLGISAKDLSRKLDQMESPGSGSPVAKVSATASGLQRSKGGGELWTPGKGIIS
jgi:hypothetical protein